MHQYKLPRRAMNIPLCIVAADQTRMMQDQMSGAAMAMPPDPSKAFKVCQIVLMFYLEVPTLCLEVM